MTFDESANKRQIYATFLYKTYKNLNRNLIKMQKINLKRLAVRVVLLLGILVIGDNLFQMVLYEILSVKGSAYQIPKTSEYALIYVLALIWGALVTSCIAGIQKLFKKKNSKQDINDFDAEVANFAGKFFLKPRYIFLTYISEDDKEKHKDEIAQVARNNPHKKVVVYVLPYRVPYIVRFDEYVFCFAVKDGKMQLLGIVSDNKDHTMPAILAQTHKVGPMMKGEEVEKNYEIVN